MASDLHTLQKKQIAVMVQYSDLLREAADHIGELMDLERTPELPISPCPDGGEAAAVPPPTRGGLLGHVDDLEDALERGDGERARRAARNLRLAPQEL